MSGSDRKTFSKWDSRDQPEFSSYSTTSSNSSKWSYMEKNDKFNPRMRFSYEESFSGGRVSNKDEEIKNKDYRVSDAQDPVGSYKMEMSPSEDCINKYSQTPKTGCSRSVRSNKSRSRNPPSSLRWDSRINYKMRAKGLTPECRDFAAGQCKRGSQCRFLHGERQHFDVSWVSRHKQDVTLFYYTPLESGDSFRTSGRSNETCIDNAKGKCSMGASCTHVHHENSFNKVSADESTREMEIDRRSSFQHGGRHGTNQSSDIPCKYFAFGNCRNGKDCRFSHYKQECQRPNTGFRDDILRSSGGDQALDRPTLSDEVSLHGRLMNDRKGLDGSMADVENKVESLGGAKPAMTAWSISDGWGNSLDKNVVHGKSLFSSDIKEVNWTAKDDCANIQTSRSVGADIWPANEKMSPDWNYDVRSSIHIEEEHEQSKQKVVPEQVFRQNVNVLHSSSSQAVEQSQVAPSIVPPRVRQNKKVFTEKKNTVEANIIDANLSQVGSSNPPIQNMISEEKLAQLTTFPASLVHMLGASQQLPQLSAASVSSDAKDTPILSKTEGSGKPVSKTFIKPDPAVGFRKLCDPRRNSKEPKNVNAKGVVPTFSPIKNIPKDTVEIPSLVSKLGHHFDDSKKPAFSEEQFVKRDYSIQLHKGESQDNKVAQGKGSCSCEIKITERNRPGPSKKLDQNSGPEETKKIKNMKRIHAFKISLVEFIKELLKPTWKHGKITKEDYKVIVKKVTDKVTGTVQRAHVPQNQEQINRYLSSSKPKLDKLLQAYLEKVKKVQCRYRNLAM